MAVDTKLVRRTDASGYQIRLHRGHDGDSVYQVIAAPVTPSTTPEFTSRDLQRAEEWRAARAPVLASSVPLIGVRPRTIEQRQCLESAAKKAKVSLSYYLLESALMVAAEEGFSPKNPGGWQPKRRA